MKSKRKQVNKLKNKQQTSEQAHESDQIQKRTSGVKPFHLSKVRTQKRLNQQILTKKASSDLLLQKYAPNKNLNSDSSDVYLDLIIKKKLLIDVQKNVTLQSQRKKPMYLNEEPKNEGQSQKVIVECVNTEETCLNDVSKQNFQAFKSEDFSNKKPKHKRSKSNCECCHQIHGYTTQAIICKTSEFYKMTRSPSAQGSNSEASFQKDRIDPKAELKNIIQKTSKSPFSFTNLKWRSKSQLAVVDKWKQKYELTNESSNSLIKKQKSTSKILTGELQVHYEFSKTRRQSKDRSQKEKLTFPAISKSNQLQSQIQFSQTKKSSTTKQLQVEEKQGKTQKKKQMKVQKEQIKIAQMVKRKTISGQKFLNKDSNIVIKEMFSKEHPEIQTVEQKKATKQQKDTPNDKYDQILTIIKQEKHKNKKSKTLRSKFPEIKVSTFYSTKEDDDEKKRLRLINLQKIVSSSKPKPIKKTYFEKSLSQIPERWQYGESREESRQQVQEYITIKKQELVEEQKKRRSELTQFNETQNNLQQQNIQKIQELLINKDC